MRSPASMVFAVVALTSSMAHAIDGPTPGAVSATKVKLPDGPSSVRGLADAAQVQIASAQVEYSIPIDVPTTAGLAPALAISYRGDLGNGSLGIGWSLDHAAIRRSTRNGVPRFDDSDELEISGLANGRLIRIADGTYRVEGSGNAVRAVRSGNRWTITDSDGTIYYFGLTTSSRQEAHIGTQLRTVAWFPEMIVHLSGRSLTYQYLHDKGQVYLAGATWGPLNKYRVEVAYASRGDAVVSFRDGFEVTTALRATSIRVMSSGATVLRTYQVTYDDSLAVTRLASVTMTGLDGNGALPTVTFGYAPRSSGTRTELAGLEGWRLNAREVSFFDVDGDGLDDLLRLEMGNHEYRKNLGGAFGPERPLTGATAIALSNAQLLDLDGDARAELVRVVDDSWRAYRIDATRSQWTAMGEWQGTVGVPLGGPGVVLADLNADGRTDVIRGSATNLMVNFASKTGMGATQVLPRISASDVNVEPGLATVRFTDVNGDGLADVVWLTDSWMKQFLGRGDGTFVPWRRVFYPWGPGVIELKNLLLQDLDRDGIVDLIRISAGHVAMYPGRPDGTFDTARALARPESADADVVVTVADANGNGSLDVIWSSPRGMWLLDLAGATSAGMLTSIDNGLGQITRFTYQTSAILSVEAENAARTWERKLPVSIAVPVRTDTLVAGSPTRTVHWGVRDGFWDGEERRFGGFLETSRVVPGATGRDTQVTVSRQHAGIGLERVLRGNTTLARLENGLGEILTETTTVWEAFRMQSLPDYDLLRRPISRSIVTSHHEGLPTPLSTVKFVVVDLEGRAIEEYDDGRVDLHGDETRVSRVYAADDTIRWIRDRVCEESTYSGDGEVLMARSRRYFGGTGPGEMTINPLCTTGLGLERRIQGWLEDESRWVTLTETEYDSYWNPVKIFAEGVWRTFGYDPFGLYLTSEVVDPADLALSHTMSWDQVRDLPMSMVDPSGVDVRVTFDSLGRLNTVALGANNPYLHYAYDWNAPTPSTRAYSFAGVVTATPVFAGAFAPGLWRESVAVANGAGEKLFDAVRLEAARWIISDSEERDARGRTIAVADAFHWDNASLAGVTIPGPPHPRQMIDYDGFDRVVRLTLATGAKKTVAYKAFETTTTDDELAPVTSLLDGQGRIRRTQRVVSGTTESVDATYDALDRITAMTLQKAQSSEFAHSFVYDTLSRFVFANDPDIGNRNLAYDDAGRLVEYTNGAMQTVAFEYDGAGRVVSRSTAGVSFTYHYDDAYEPGTFHRTAGRLAWVEEPTGRVQFGYDVMGRLAHLRRTVNGQTADEVTSLSATGDPLQIDYQDGVVLTMHYDDAERLIGLGDLWSLEEQDPGGRISRESFGNGIETAYQRDRLGEATDIAVKRGATELYRAMNIQRNAYGAITSVTDNDGHGLDHNATFTYDGAGRLSNATIGTGMSQKVFSYVFDGLQNMKSRTGAGNGTLVGQYNYGEPRMMGGPARGPRQLTSIVTTSGTVAFDYDAAGRQTQQGPITVEYDGLDQLVRVSGVPGSSGDVVHGYGYDGLRVLTQHPGGATQVWFTPNLSQTNGARERYVRIDDRLIARLKLDWIGEEGGASTSGSTVASLPSRPRAIIAGLTLALVFFLLALSITKRRLRWRLAPAGLACASAFLGCSWFSSKSQAVWEISDTTYYHQGIGAGPTLMTREDGTILEERRFEPFGDELDAFREPPGGGPGIVGLINFVLEPHGITNKPTDPTTGWSYHGARWMAPETARWLTPDPPVKTPDADFMSAPWSLHPYQYVEQNPILFWDPDGNNPARGTGPGGGSRGAGPSATGTRVTPTGPKHLQRDPATRRAVREQEERWAKDGIGPGHESVTGVPRSVHQTMEKNRAIYPDMRRAAQRDRVLQAARQYFESKKIASTQEFRAFVGGLRSSFKSQSSVRADPKAILEQSRAALNPKADQLRTFTINQHASGHLSVTGSVKPNPAQRKVFQDYGILDVPVHGKSLCLPGPCGHHGEQRGMAHGINTGNPVVRQWSSSGAGHGGKACTNCAAAQKTHGVDNPTGAQ
jgi:RHS repeat-associated protein